MAHVAARFNDEPDGTEPVHTGNRIEGREHRLKWGQTPITLRRESLERLVQKVDLGEDLLEEKGVMRPEAPVQGSANMQFPSRLLA